MGQRSGAPETEADAAKLSLSELNDWISRAEFRALHAKLSASLKTSAMKRLVWRDSHTRLLLEKKDDMRRRGAATPDEWDAVALMFAEPVGAGPGFSRKLTYPEIGVV